MLASLRTVLVLLLGIPFALTAEPVHVSGRVLASAETFQGIAGARVELLSQTGEAPVATAKTGAGGFFELTAPESGCFRMRLQAQGYSSMEESLLPLTGETGLMVPLVPGSGAPTPGTEVFDGTVAAPAPATPSPATPRLVQGKVRDPKGAPVPGALVWSESSPAVPCAKAGADGSFQIRLPAGSPAKLRAAGPGYLPSDPQEPPPAGSQTPLTLKLDPAGSITGQVVDEAGQPLARVQIMALPMEWDGGSPGVGVAWSRADGRFHLPLLAPGQVYEVTAAQDGFAPASVQVDALFRDRRPKPVRIVLARGATLTGKLLDPEGKPVSGAELKLTPSKEMELEMELGLRFSWDYLSAGTAASDAAGSFAIPHLIPGQFKLQVKHRGLVPLTVPEIEVPAKSPWVDLGALTLDRSAVIEGRVTDPAGAPVAEAQVNVRPESFAEFVDAGSFGEARTDSEGRFRIEDLHRGMRFDLSVGHPGHIPATVDSVEAPTPEPLRIELKTGRTLAGRVRSPEGKPVPKAEIFLFLQPAPPIGGLLALGVTDEEGKFRLAGLQPSVVELIVQAMPYQLAHLQGLRIPEESEVEGLEITLQKGNVLEVQALDGHRQPVAGARIIALADALVSLGSISPRDCQTDDAGRCRLEGLDPGLYIVNAMSHQQGEAQVAVEIAPGVNQREIVFPAVVTVSGQVSDDTGAPVAGAHLILHPRESSEHSETFSLADGSFQFQVVREGIYFLSGVAPGFADTAAPGEIQVAGQEVRGLVVRLSRGVTVTGKVLGLDPEELASVSINAYPMGGGDLPFANSLSGRPDREGRYKLSLAPREWRIAAEASGRSIQEPLHIAPGVREAVLDLRFPTGFTLTGRVTADRVPLAGAQVSGSSEGGGFQTQTGPDGGFQVPNVPPGRYTVRAMDPEGLRASATVEVTGDQEANLDFTTGGLRVTVFAGGVPVVNADIFVGKDDTAARSRRETDAAGSLEIPRLASGTYTVFADKAGFEEAQTSVEVHPGTVTAVRIELKPAQ